ncbi:MAG: rod shape-determining protein RodA [Desulfitibacter sp. BRH_c19]|nr:MAG: rod shape-determining protein RodA [Desulfitibacter sp. BRH_c19]
MNLPEKKMLKNIDYMFVLALIGILGLSITVMPSASAINTSNPFFFVKRQLIFIAIGLVAITFILSFDYKQFQKYSKYLYALNIIILLLVLSPLGHSAKGAQRWITMGPFAFQASEFAKILVIITFADFLAKRQGKLETLKQLIPCLVFVAIPMLLVLMQPDLGTSLVFVAIFIGMMFIAGANPKLLVGLISTGLLGGIGLIYSNLKWGTWVPLKDYQLMRLVVFLNPYEDGMGGRGAGYQLIQSQVAVGSGGLTGKGLFQGSQVQLNFLPEHHTDFIFSVVGEELGFIGAVIILALYFFLVYRSIDIMANAKDMFGVLMVAGITSMLVFHVFVNVGMAIGIMPITGLPLPLFSYGGSSMLANLIGLGIVLNVNIRRKKIIF